METKTSAIRKRHTEIDMTRGSIFMHLLRFMLPLLAGNIFQQLYNMVDTWVVGNYVSNEAFSAVGSAGPITFTLIGFFMGLSNGAGVITAQYFGAGKPESVQKTVHTAILMTLILAVLFTGIGIAFTPHHAGLYADPGRSPARGHQLPDHLFCRSLRPDAV